MLTVNMNRRTIFFSRGLIGDDTLFSDYHSTVQYSTVQYSTVRYSTVQYSAVQYSTVQYNRILRDEEH